MCGIFAILGKIYKIHKSDVMECSALLRHRGPDSHSLVMKNNDTYSAFAHERLSIVDVSDNANQPFIFDDKVLIINGEIYNHQEIREEYKDFKFQSDSDCESVMALWELSPEVLINKLDGVFAFVLADKDSFIIARDAIGVMPLYYGKGVNGELYVASEIKAIVNICKHIDEFPAGHYLTNNMFVPKRWYKPIWLENYLTNIFEFNEVVYEKIAETLEKAVIKRLMTDVPYGVLLSGGLDSSLIAALVNKHIYKRVEDGEKSEAWYPRLHTFSIGLKDSPDICNARIVAKFLNTVHHEFVITEQDAINTIKSAVYHLETFDVASIRSGIPMMLLAKKIRAMGFKVVLNGDGADEIFGSYRYNIHAPNPMELHKEACRKVLGLSKYDCLRCNKSMMAHSVECRCPYLDKEFVELVMNIDPKYKMHDIRDFADTRVDKNIVEKYILRRAFCDKEMIPDEILWRTKVQFSSGCGENMNKALIRYAETIITDDQFSKRCTTFPHKTPYTKEAYLYRFMFEQFYPYNRLRKECVPYEKSMNCSTEIALKWNEKMTDTWDPCGTEFI